MEDHIISVYEERGHEHYAKGSDVNLAHWGNSPERIREIKIDSVLTELYFARHGIETFKMLNEKLGGVNKDIPLTNPPRC